MTGANPAVLIAVGTFCGIGLFVVGVYYFFVVRTEAAERETLRQRIRTGGSATVGRRVSSILKEAERLSAIGALNSVLSRAVAANMRTVIAQSGVKVTPGRLVLGSACLGLVVEIAVTTYTRMPWLGVGLGVAFLFAPYMVVRWLRDKRRRKFEEHFPEAIDLIARTLRAGHAFTTGLRMAADEMPEPVAAEFKLLHDQQNYGLPMTESMRNFADRMPIIDARFFVTAVLTQREAGGNLAEVLDNLSTVIRERFRIKRQLRVITAHGRLTGLVLTVMPVALAVYLMLRTPEHFRILIDDPEGRRLLMGAVGLQILGALLIRKLTDVEY